MSRPNAALVLAFMGHKPEVDFFVVGTPTEAFITWLSAQPQPTDAEIDAAAPAAEAAYEAKVIADAEDAARKDEAKQAYATLTNIISGAQTVIDDPTVTNAEAVTYIKQLANAVQTLAQVEQHLIRALIGR